MNYRLCPKCNGKVSFMRMECRHCGEALTEKICPDCGKMVDASVFECPDCGHYFINYKKLFDLKPTNDSFVENSIVNKEEIKYESSECNGNIENEQNDDADNSTNVNSTDILPSNNSIVSEDDEILIFDDDIILDEDKDSSHSSVQIEIHIPSQPNLNLVVYSIQLIYLSFLQNNAVFDKTKKCFGLNLSVSLSLIEKLNCFLPNKLMSFKIDNGYCISSSDLCVCVNYNNGTNSSGSIVGACSSLITNLIGKLTTNNLTENDKKDCKKLCGIGINNQVINNMAETIIKSVGAQYFHDYVSYPVVENKPITNGMVETLAKLSKMDEILFLDKDNVLFIEIPLINFKISKAYNTNSEKRKALQYLVWKMYYSVICASKYFSYASEAKRIQKENTKKHKKKKHKKHKNKNKHKSKNTLE